MHRKGSSHTMGLIMVGASLSPPSLSGNRATSSARPPCGATVGAGVGSYPDQAPGERPWSLAWGIGVRIDPEPRKPAWRRLILSNQLDDDRFRVSIAALPISRSRCDSSISMS